MTGHNPLTREFVIKLDKLRDFAGLVEEKFVAEVEALEARLAERAREFEEDERSEFYEYHAEDYVELADDLPTILRYSVLSSADAALEVYLNNTCQTYTEVHEVRVQLSDFRGRGITRARDYLKKVAGISFPDQHPAWTAVCRLHEVRNSIIHADGVVPRSNTELRSWSIEGLRIAGDRVSLARSFTKAALDVYKEFGLAVDRSCEGLDLWESVFPTEYL